MGLRISQSVIAGIARMRHFLGSNQRDAITLSETKKKWGPKIIGEDIDNHSYIYGERYINDHAFSFSFGQISYFHVKKVSNKGFAI